MENPIISYIIKASLAMLMLYGLYAFCFRRDTFNKIKRFYLLFVILFSLIYPFCKFNISGVENIAIYEAILPQIELTNNDISEVGQQSIFGNMSEWLFLIILGGMLILSIRLLIQIAGVINLRVKNISQTIPGCKIVSLNEATTPFSFFNWIFVPNDDFTKEDMDIMIKHEKEHVDQYHSIDILLSELFCILFWWNPISWLLKREIRINLEYLADKGVLENGVESKKYQYLLLQVIKPSATIQIVNNFNVSQLKKRITMINKKRTSGFMSFKYLLALPIVVLMLLGNAQKVFSGQIEKVLEKPIVSENSELLQQEKDKPFTVVDEMPKYPGGEKAMMEYIATNLKYPELAAKENIQGRVVIRFIISKTGKISDITVVRSLDSRCDEEAMRVVREMPTWTPGKQKGQAVAVYYTLPILYKLKKDTPKTTPTTN